MDIAYSVDAEEEGSRVFTDHTHPFLPTSRNGKAPPDQFDFADLSPVPLDETPAPPSPIPMPYPTIGTLPPRTEAEGSGGGMDDWPTAESDGFDFL